MFNLILILSIILGLLACTKKEIVFLRFLGVFISALIIIFLFEYKYEANGNPRYVSEKILDIDEDYEPMIISTFLYESKGNENESKIYLLLADDNNENPIYYSIDFNSEINDALTRGMQRSAKENIQLGISLKKLLSNKSTDVKESFFEIDRNSVRKTMPPEQESRTVF